jgi:hypothetical protein
MKEIVITVLSETINRPYTFSDKKEDPNRVKYRSIS